MTITAFHRRVRRLRHSGVILSKAKDLFRFEKILQRPSGLRVTRVVGMLVVILVTPAAGQKPSPPLVKYGKWAAVVASAGFTALAARAHSHAEDNFNLLRGYCFVDSAHCATGTDGRYLDPQSERWYQESVRYDHRSRNWLFAGEGALLGAAVGFVWELTRPKGPPGNIPFEPKVTSVKGETRVGVQVAF